MDFRCILPLIYLLSCLPCYLAYRTTADPDAALKARRIEEVKSAILSGLGMRQPPFSASGVPASESMNYPTTTTTERPNAKDLEPFRRYLEDLERQVEEENLARVDFPEITDKFIAPRRSVIFFPAHLPPNKKVSNETVLYFEFKNAERYYIDGRNLDRATLFVYVKGPFTDASEPFLIKVFLIIDKLDCPQPGKCGHVRRQLGQATMPVYNETTHGRWIELRMTEPARTLIDSRDARNFGIIVQAGFFDEAGRLKMQNRAVLTSKEKAYRPYVQLFSARIARRHKPDDVR